MATPSAQDIAAEYKRILDEGWTPDVDEFLRHVPEELRAESRQKIEELVAELESVIDDTDTAIGLVAGGGKSPVLIDLDGIDDDVDGDAETDGDIIVEQPAVEPASKPKGPVKLSREEARAMFAAMSARS